MVQFSTTISVENMSNSVKVKIGIAQNWIAARKLGCLTLLSIDGTYGATVYNLVSQMFDLVPLTVLVSDLGPEMW